MGFLDNLKKGSAGTFLNASSGILNFGLNQIGAAIQHKRDMKKMAKQQEYSLAQMSQGQEYNLETMAKQNEYQIAAENRANAYNSVGAQVERARQAGVSPLAALGSGGAGGTMSVSSAPSGGSPSGSAPSGGVPSSSGSAFFDLARGAELGATIALKSSEQALADSERRLADEKRMSLEWDNLWKSIDAGFANEYAKNKQLTYDIQYVESKLKQAYISGGKSSPQYQLWMEEYNNLKADTQNKTNSAVTQMSLADYYEASADYYMASTGLAKEQSKDLIATRESRVKKAMNDAFNAYAQAMLARKQSATESERKKLVSAQSEEAKARKKEIDKQVERLGKLNSLSDAQIKQIQNNINLAWWKFGVDTARAASQEARAWIYPYSDAFQKKQSTFSPSPTDWSSDTGYNPFDY